MNTPFAYKAARWGCLCRCCCQAPKDKRRGAAQVSLRGVGRVAHTPSHTRTHWRTHLQRLCATRCCRQRRQQEGRVASQTLTMENDEVSEMNVARCRSSKLAQRICATVLVALAFWLRGSVGNARLTRRMRNGIDCLGLSLCVEKKLGMRQICS